MSDGTSLHPAVSLARDLVQIEAYATIHKIDECCATADLERLSSIYEVLLGRLVL